MDSLPCVGFVGLDHRLGHSWGAGNRPPDPPPFFFNNFIRGPGGLSPW